MQRKFANVAAIYENDADLKKEDVDAVKEWLKAQAHLPEIQELQLLLFFHSCYYNIEATKKCIEQYYTMRSKIPMFFTDRNVLSEDLQFQLQVSLITPLPSTTPDNYIVFYIRLIDTIPANYIYSTQVKMLDMAIQLALLQKGPKPGLVAIFDMEGTSFGHLFRINPFTSKKFVDYVQEALPVRLKAVHLVNVNTFTAQFVTLLKPFMKRQLTQLEAMPVRLKEIHLLNVSPISQRLISLVKPFLKSDIIEMLHVHGSVDGLFDYVPKEALPVEYGGQGGEIKDIIKQQRKEFEANEDYFAIEEAEIANDSCRIDKLKNIGDIFGSEGTFKKLEID